MDGTTPVLLHTTPVGQLIHSVVGDQGRVYFEVGEEFEDRTLWTATRNPADTSQVGGLPPLDHTELLAVDDQLLITGMEAGVFDYALWRVDGATAVRIEGANGPESGARFLQQAGDRAILLFDSGFGREPSVIDFCRGACCIDVFTPDPDCCLADADCACGTCDTALNACVAPSATEIACDGEDNDCDPATPDDDGTCDMVMDVADTTDVGDATSAHDSAVGTDASDSETTATDTGERPDTDNPGDDQTVADVGADMPLDAAASSDGGCCTTVRRPDPNEDSPLPHGLALGAFLALLWRRRRR